MVWALWIGVASAKSWCASPLYVHEWGVEVLRVDGGTPLGPAVPEWFHRTGPDPIDVVPVRHLPADSGVRTLPVVQFYAPSSWAPVAVGFEVGFTEGQASLWYPQVDQRRDADEANGAEAAAARDALLRARAERQPRRAGTPPPLPPDPTRQLGWDALSLSPKVPAAPRPTDVAWVHDLRAIDGALWVQRGDEADRFLFYEADTGAAPDLVVQGRTLRNVSDWMVHDVVLIADGRAWTAPAIPPGATATIELEALDKAAVEAWLRGRWTDGDGPPPWQMDMDDCVMMEDPAVPVQTALGHRLYAPEIEALMVVWADRLLAADGVRLLYREDAAALDARMPVSVYSDMLHYVQLQRLGLVVVEGLTLP